jgi:hypothetical protein
MRLTPVARAGTVAVGCLAALAIAFLVVKIRVAATSGPDREDYGSRLSVAVLRILVAPLFVLFFLLSSFLAPNRSVRISLLLATGIEMAAFAAVTFTWFHSSRQAHPPARR